MSDKVTVDIEGVEGSPNWQWKELGYTVKRGPCRFGSKLGPRYIYDQNGCQVNIEIREGEDRFTAELRTGREHLASRREEEHLELFE